MYHYPFNQTGDALPNLTLLGDAAYRMPPYAGEGVNMAMQDALQLYESLTNPAFGTLHAAIAHYESIMRARASEVTSLSVMQTEALHARDGLEYLVNLFAQ
jgi:2-polyprenyl-6-methoxyphenol hydroxylase-like FAD-dependent oxidoreductase